jgi:shikimate dehydrogenase
MKFSNHVQNPGMTGLSPLVFILGHPLGHSLSPQMHNAAFRTLGLSWVYVPLDVSRDKVRTAVEAIRSLNVRGANVTVPYKEEVAAYLDYVEKEARGLGSVNTIFRRGEKLLGASTDGEGFLRSLGSWRNKLRGSKGLMIGAGGSAKAVAEALAGSGVKSLFVANRSFSKAVQLVGKLSKRHRRIQSGALSLKEGERYLNQCDWVVQATSVGLKKGDPSPLHLKGARFGTLVVDLIYHRETAFLKEAQRLRLPNLGGLGMLLHQGALSFEYWTGQKAPLSVMHKALLEC